jgi:transposase
MKAVIGIDVSKQKLDCLWLRDINTRKVKAKVHANTSEGHRQLLAWVQKQTGESLSDCLFVMEATGIYHERLAYALHEAGAQVAVLNPAQVRDYAKGIAVRTKNDNKDAMVLALYGAKESVRRWQPEPEPIRRLKGLLSRLEALEADILRENNRLEKAHVGRSTPAVVESIEKVLAQLEQETTRVERLINEHIDNAPQLKNDQRLLETIPGVGKVLSRYMMSVFHSRQFESASQMAAYLGVVPVEYQSGTSVHKRPKLSKAGSATIRAKLYLPAVVATQYNPTAKALYERLLQRGKAKMAAIGAVMRKLVHICFGVLKNQTAYSLQAV